MRIIEPSVEYVGGNVDLMNRAKHVELCGRVCYKSENRITEDSAEKFISNIIKRGHEAVLEHARITLNLSREDHHEVYRLIHTMCEEMRNHGIDPFMTLTHGELDDSYVVSGNMRAWRNLCKFMWDCGYGFPDVIKRTWAENAPFFPEYFHEDDPYINDTITDINPDNPYFPGSRIVHGWHTLRFICDRGISHEIVRHRVASYCQESTRYCNYTGADFDSQITVIRPHYLQQGTFPYNRWKFACEATERAYFDLMTHDFSAQEARCVLPTCLKTEVVMTAANQEWLHFFELRTAEAAHPQMRRLATQALEILKEKEPEVFGNE